MTPDAHGYLRCSRCRCWRPATTLTPHVERYADVEVTLHHCTDTAVCSRLADVGAGRLDADTGYVCTCDRPEGPHRFGCVAANTRLVLPATGGGL